MIITSLSFLGFILFIYQRYKIAPEVLPLITILLQIIAIYICGVFGVLHGGAYVISIAGLVLLLYSIIELREKTSIFEFTRNLMKPGFVFFFLAQAGVIYILSKVSYYTVFDDYSHWGTAVKFLHLNHHFATNNDQLAFAAYPPGLIGYLYYTSLYIGNSIGVNVAMQNSLIIAACALFFKNIDWKNYFAILLRIIIVPLVIYAFSMRGWITLSSDHILGVLFGVSLISGYKYSRSLNSSVKEVESYVLMAATLAVMPLIKETGIIFSLVSVTSYIILCFYCDFQNGRLQFRRLIEKDIVVVIALTLFTKLSWLTFVITNNIYDVININKISFIDFIQMIHEGNTVELTHKAGKYLSGLLSYNLPLAITIPEAALLLAIASIVIITIIDKKERTFFLILFAFVILMFFPYLSVIAYAYIVIWPPYVLESLNSIERYHGSYLLGWALLVLMVFLSEEKIKNTYKMSIWITLFLLAIVNKSILLNGKIITGYKNFFVVSHDINEHRYHKKIYKDIVGIKVACETIKESVQASSNMLVVYEDFFTKHKINYHLLGRKFDIIERALLINSDGVVKNNSQLRKFEYLVNLSDKEIAIYDAYGKKHIIPPRMHGEIDVFRLENEGHTIKL